jgi:hypothetical protein
VSKKLVLGSKSSEKFGKVWKFRKLDFLNVRKLDFPKVRKLDFPNVRKFRKLLFSELSEIYKKMTLNSNFGNREKLVPT